MLNFTAWADYQQLEKELEQNGKHSGAFIDLFIDFRSAHPEISATALVVALGV